VSHAEGTRACGCSPSSSAAAGYSASRRTRTSPRRTGRRFPTS
jgi:hypothetical protein